MLNQDFKEFVELLNANAVEYLVVGGYAMSAYARPRNTGDIDFWVKAHPENAKKILKTLHEFGMASLNVTEDTFTQADHILQIGYEPRRIDILTSIDGVDFDDCYPRRFEAFHSGVMIKFIGLEDFKRNKAAANRPKDQADIKDLGA
jgi:predicted nucleotidyltransferase